MHDVLHVSSWLSVDAIVKGPKEDTVLPQSTKTHVLFYLHFPKLLQSFSQKLFKYKGVKYFLQLWQKTQVHAKMPVKWLTGRDLCMYLAQPQLTSSTLRGYCLPVLRSKLNSKTWRGGAVKGVISQNACAVQSPLYWVPQASCHTSGVSKI